MVQPVVTDADMLFGATTRALFIYLDYADVVRLHWSQRILTEMSDALVRTGRKPDLATARVHEERMNLAVGSALVDQARVDRHEPAMAAYVKDPGDAHVAACAYELVTGGYYPSGQAVVLSTRNLGDYKIEELIPLGISVSHPDDFLLTLPVVSIAGAFRAARIDMASKPDAERLLERLVKDGNPRVAAALTNGAAASQFEL